MHSSRAEILQINDVPTRIRRETSGQTSRQCQWRMRAELSLAADARIPQMSIRWQIAAIRWDRNSVKRSMHTRARQQSYMAQILRGTTYQHLSSFIEHTGYKITVRQTSVVFCKWWCMWTTPEIIVLLRYTWRRDETAENVIGIRVSTSPPPFGCSDWWRGGSKVRVRHTSGSVKYLVVLVCVCWLTSVYNKSLQESSIKRARPLLDPQAMDSWRWIVSIMTPR